MLSISGSFNFSGQGIHIYNLNYIIPGNSIILSSITYTGAISGWERYNLAANNLIVGTADQANIGVYFNSTGNTMANAGVSISSGGLHYGIGPYAVGGGSYYNPSSPYGDGGAHTHGGKFSNTSGSSSASSRPIHTKFVFLKTPTDTQLFPPGTVHISETSLYTGATQEIAAGNSDRYVVGGYSSKTNSNAIPHSFVFTTTGPPGDHSHSTSQADTGGTSLYGSLRTIGNYYYSESGTGISHSHTLTKSATINKLKGRLLKLWLTAASVIPQNNTIIMYDGSLSALPSYWKVCDGTNGTIDMRDYFLGYANTSVTAHGTITSSNTQYTLSNALVTTNTDWYHSHYLGSTTTYNNIILTAHGLQSVPHTHAVSGGFVSTTYEPDHLKLAFIQFLPII